jgi:hypothetical protein
MARRPTFPSQIYGDDLWSKGVGRDEAGMKTQCISIFGIHAPAYTTPVASTPVPNMALSWQPLGRSRKFLVGFHLGVLLLEKSRLEHTSNK